MLAAGAKEVCEQRPALFREQAGDDFDLVVKLGVVHDAENRAAGAGFGVGGRVDEAGDARVQDGAGAHGARFERDVEGAAAFRSEDAVVRERASGFAEGDDLGVGGGIAVAEDSVLASANDLVFVDDDCAYGDFAVGFGGLGFGDGAAEVG